MKHAGLLFCCLFLLLSGCASLKVPEQGAYPFRAEFSGTAFIKGEEAAFDGALSIVSREKGFAQVYGPMGLAAYTVDISEGRARLFDTWGKVTREYPFPYRQVLGLIAGIPPDERYLWKSSRDRDTLVTYAWGSVSLDEQELPREVHVRSTPPADLVFTREGKIITLMMTHGSDKLLITMSVIQGGRWLKGSFGTDKGGS